VNAPLPTGATWVRFPRYIGDAVMHFPLLRLLRQVAGTPLVVWGPAATVALVEGTDLVEGVLKEARKPGAWELARTLRTHGAVRSVHFPKSLRPALGAWLARVPERLGVSESLAGLVNTHTLPFWSQEGPVIERYRRVLALRWPDLGPLPFPDYVPPVAVERPQGPYLCLMPGASKPEKAWGDAAFRRLAALAEGAGLSVVVLGSPGERDLGQAVAGPKGLNLCGRTNLPEAAAWLAGAVAALGNDSGLSHLAAACGTPTLAVFGPTDPAVFGPFGPKVTTRRREGLEPAEAWAALRGLGAALPPLLQTP
jgi:ADP-heptose:LPS heptosyltransferase